MYKVTLQFLLLVLLFSFNINGQITREEQASLEVQKTISNSVNEKKMTILPLEKWAALHIWEMATDADLTKYGFTRYSKYTQAGKLYGIIKLPNDTITKTIFEYVIASFNKGIVVANNGKVGMIDTLGKLTIPTEYDEIIPFINNRGFVKKDNKYAAITYQGKLLTPFQFDEVGGYNDDISVVIVGGKIGYIDRNGKYILQPQFDDASHFFNGIAKVYSNKWESLYKGDAYQGNRLLNVNVGSTHKIPFLINKRGLKFFTGQYDDDIEISQNSFAIIGRYVFINGDKYYFESVVDTSGKVIVPFDKKLRIKSLTKEWIIIENSSSGNIGVVNYNGVELLKTSFVAVDPLKYNDEKLGVAYFDEKNYFYIDKNCKCIEFEGIKCPDK